MLANRSEAEAFGLVFEQRLVQRTQGGRKRIELSVMVGHERCVLTDLPPGFVETIGLK